VSDKLYFNPALQYLVMSSTNILIIGISGTTNSGKSTLATMLQSSLSGVKVMGQETGVKVTVKGQDTYFREPGDPLVPVTEKGVENWDCLGALHMDKMTGDVIDWTASQGVGPPQTHVLIIEGFLMFTYRPLNQLFHKKYFINVDYSVAADRRLYRSYDPPDPPGYFENVAWVEYKKHLSDIDNQKDIEYMDGSRSLEYLHMKLLKDIQDLILAEDVVQP